jgi:sarcosine oxidase subunit alpha
MDAELFRLARAMPRLRPLRDPVTLHFDGKPVPAERGEPVAASLLAAGHLALARSPKFHRPRGPACMRAACDGCLARVEGEPNVMTCRVPAADGLTIETQNVVGTRETDLLRMADWFFPEGMNHHELLAGVPGLEHMMQAFARRVAGLGKLPKRTDPSTTCAASRRQLDVLVVGAGAAGMAVTLELLRHGRSVEIVEEDLAWGGSVRALGEPAFLPVFAAFADAVDASRVALRLRTTALGIYGDDVLIGAEGGVEVVTARTLVLAPGAHDGVVSFEGNDVPGVMSARAAAMLMHIGVGVGRAVVAATEGGGPFGRAIADATGGRVLRGKPIRVRGSSRVREAWVETDGGVERVICDALLVDAPPAPAYELCAQAGAPLAHEARGFVAVVAKGRIRDGVFAAGEAVGTPLEAGAIAREAAAIAAQAP